MNVLTMAVWMYVFPLAWEHSIAFGNTWTYCLFVRTLTCMPTSQRNARAELELRCDNHLARPPPVEYSLFVHSS